MKEASVARPAKRGVSGEAVRLVTHPAKRGVWGEAEPGSPMRTQVWGEGVGAGRAMRGVWGEAVRVPPARTIRCGPPRPLRPSRPAPTTSWWGGPSPRHRIPERLPRPCSRSSPDDRTGNAHPLREDRRPHAPPLPPHLRPAFGNLSAVGAGAAVPRVRGHAGG